MVKKCESKTKGFVIFKRRILIIQECTLKKINSFLLFVNFKYLKIAFITWFFLLFKETDKFLNFLNVKNDFNNNTKFD